MEPEPPTSPPSPRPRAARRPAPTSLSAALRADVRGEVRDDPQARAMYARDASNFRQVPRAVVMPVDERDVLAAVAVCRHHGVPITCRGGGTGLAGQTVGDGVVLDFSRHMNRIVALDPERRLARVQPGLVLDTLRRAAQPHGLTFGPDPATHDRCTLGGMIGNNSCGVHSVYAGRTVDNVERLRVVTSDGECFRVAGLADDDAPEGLARRRAALADLRDRTADLVRARFPKIPRRVSGFALDELLPERGENVARSLVGTEGTCVIVVEAEVRLVHWPRARALVVAGYPSVYEAADHVPEVLACGPVGLEAIDAELVRLLREKGFDREAIGWLPEGGGWLFVELGGDDEAEARRAAERVERALRGASGAPRVARILGEADQHRMWNLRESSLAATAVTDGREAWEGFEDAAVAPERLGAYLRAFRALLDRYGYRTALYGHFGDGCVHCRITYDPSTQAGLDRWKAFLREGAELVASFGGSLSGEHGDGQQRAQLLPILYGDALVAAFAEFERIWDPAGLFNPGKVVDPPPLEAHLALGPGFRAADPPTVFTYPRRSFAWEASRCVGVGLCRRDAGGVMCPSFKVLHQEQHSTRGRARLLQEMLRPDSPIRDGWRSDSVADALDLCLSCKGCRTECPMAVDMARMKAEFVHHRYRGRIRPRTAYTLGLIPVWARLARAAPEVVNAALRAPGLGGALKRLAGMSPRREAPAFAPRTFRSWWRARPRRPTGQRVVLWVDTWTEHFRPEVGIAAVEVLEALGDRVDVVPGPVCCGRPLYEHGMIRLARHWLDRASRALAQTDDDDAPVVFLEPSCHATFRDELLDFWPDDPVRRCLHRRIRTLAQHVEARTRDRDLPWTWTGRVVVHGHCHQRSGTGIDAEERVLARLGAEVVAPDTGCCGMAGTFGYEPHKVDLSIAIAEKEGFLPAMRTASPGTALMVDGFSCGSQLGDRLGRRPLHLAQVLRLPRGSAHGDGPIESVVPRAPGPSRRRRLAPAGLALVLLAAVVGLARRRWEGT